MAMYQEPRIPELHRLVRAAVRAANEVVTQAEKDNRYIGTHFDFPTKVSTSEHGWPFVTTSFSSGPTNYDDAFGLKSDEKKPAYRDVPELAACIDFLLADQELRRRVNDGYESSADDRLATINAAWIVTGILDRARHEAGPDFTNDVIDRLYLDLEPRLVLDRLPIEILVPILLTRFDIEGRIEVAEHVAIERMDDGTNRARAYAKQYYSEVNPFLLQAATHALVLEGYDMPAVAPMQHRLSFWPVDRIDTFFRALEIVEDVPTGYGQIIFRPLEWAPRWMVDLPPIVKATSTSRYPPWFENGGWNTAGSIYPVQKLDRVGEVFSALTEAHRSVGVATRRLGSATLRSRTDDKVIDLCIALEALFGERGPEVTHKLATRVAAAMCLTGQTDVLSATDTFRAVKQIYDFRSRVVHGEDQADPKRRFVDAAGNEHDVVSLVRTLLRGAISSVLARPDLIEPGEVDRLILIAVQEHCARRNC